MKKAPIYAGATTVTIDKSRSQIEKMLARFGATAFMSAWDQHRAVFAFDINGHRMRFTLIMPDFDSDEFVYRYYKGKRTSTKLSDKSRMQKSEQAKRQKWRALELTIKAKLTAIKSGIVSFEDEFLAYYLMPDGKSYGESARLQIGASNPAALILGQ